MRWRLLAFIAILPFVLTETAHTQTDAPIPTCEVACSVNPFTAPASCNCNGPEDTDSPASPDPAPNELPLPIEPAVPNCQLACQVNPFTAPPTCDCTNIATSSSDTPGPGPASGPVSPDAILEDDILEVGELLEFMEQLYRARIAGVQTYYFLERMIVGQPTPLVFRDNPSGVFRPASWTAAQSARIRPVSLASPAEFSQNPIVGVDTILNVLKFFEKVQQNGHPAMKNVPRGMDPEFAQTEEGQAAQAILGFLQGLSNAAAETAEEAEYHDVLEELLQLKAAYDEASSGRVRVFLGSYNREERLFSLGPRCASGNTESGCSYIEFRDFLWEQADVNPSLMDPSTPAEDELYYPEEAKIFEFLQNNRIAIVWQVGEGPLRGLDLSTSNEPDGARPLSAELWFSVAELYSASPSFTYEDFEGAYHDRPFRMLLVYDVPQQPRPWLLERVYEDHQLVEAANQLQPLFEPHKIIQQFGQTFCPDDIPEDVPLEPAAAGCFQAWKENFVLQAISETHRKDFMLNQARPSSIDETQMLAAPW